VTASAPIQALAEQVVGPLPHASDNLKMALARITKDAAYRDRYHPDFGWEWLTRKPEQSASLRKLHETLERLSDERLQAHSKDQRKFERDFARQRENRCG
jgi:hypothetical protein